MPTDDSGRISSSKPAMISIRSSSIYELIPVEIKNTFSLNYIIFKAGKIESIEVRKGIFITALHYKQSLKDVAWEADGQVKMEQREGIASKKLKAKRSTNDSTLPKHAIKLLQKHKSNRFKLQKAE